MRRSVDLNRPAPPTVGPGPHQPFFGNTLFKAYNFDFQNRAANFAIYQPSVTDITYAMRHSTKNQFGSFEKNTSYPVLIIGNTAARIECPTGCNNSVVLTQNSSGYCSISAASLCTSKAVRSYFLNGTLPEKGTVCQTESSIFGSALDLADFSTAEDLVPMQAAEELRRMQIVPRLFDVSPTDLVDWGSVR